MKYIITEEQYNKLWFLRRNRHIKEVVEDTIKLLILLDVFKMGQDYFVTEVIFRSAKKLASIYQLNESLQTQLEDYIKIHFDNMISNAWSKESIPTKF